MAAFESAFWRLAHWFVSELFTSDMEEPSGNISGNVSECVYYGTEDVGVKIWLIVVFASTVAVVALGENIFLSYLFASHPKFSRSHLFYMSVLAVMDIFVSISYLALMTVPVLYDYYRILSLFHVWLAYFKYVLVTSVSVMTASAYLIVMATFERMVKMIMAGSGLRRFLEQKRPWIALTIICSAILFRGSQFWEIKVVQKEHCREVDGGFAEFNIDIADFVKLTPVYHKWWVFYIRNIVHSLVPFFSLLLMNVIILSRVRRELSAHTKSLATAFEQMVTPDRTVQSTRQSLRDATRMLICVVIMYLISNVLNITLVIWESIDQDGLIVDYYYLYSYSADIVSILTVCCCALRLPVYCICNQTIRGVATTMLRQMFSKLCCCCRVVLAKSSVDRGYELTNSSSGPTHRNGQLQVLLNAPSENDEVFTYEYDAVTERTEVTPNSKDNEVIYFKEWTL